ncbi:MAG: hypothetical protein R6W68_16280 [Ignavibacteriaceae bacterium]
MPLVLNYCKHGDIPDEFYLDQNIPNPFKENTTIKYCVPCKTKVIFIVINSEGEVVEKLISKEQIAGFHEVNFYAGGLSAGTYFYQLIADKYSRCEKMELVK